MNTRCSNIYTQHINYWNKYPSPKYIYLKNKISISNPVSRPVHLFTSIFFKSGRDSNEIITALEMNVANPIITNVTILLENGDLPDHLKNNLKVNIIKRPSKWRTKYSDLINLIPNDPNTINILINNDIIISHKNLDMLYNISKNDMVTLTRWETSGSYNHKDIQKFHENSHLNNNFASSDTWIFLGKPPVYGDIYIGIPGCENMFINEFYKLGYNIINLGNIIPSYHLHRNLNSREAYPFTYYFLSTYVITFIDFYDGTDDNSSVYSLYKIFTHITDGNFYSLLGNIFKNFWNIDINKDKLELLDSTITTELNRLIHEFKNNEIEFYKKEIILSEKTNIENTLSQIYSEKMDALNVEHEDKIERANILFKNKLKEYEDKVVDIEKRINNMDLDFYNKSLDFEKKINMLTVDSENKKIRIKESLKTLEESIKSQKINIKDRYDKEYNDIRTNHNAKVAELDKKFNDKVNEQSSKLEEYFLIEKRRIDHQINKLYTDQLKEAEEEYSIKIQEKDDLLNNIQNEVLKLEDILKINYLKISESQTILDNLTSSKEQQLKIIEDECLVKSRKIEYDARCEIKDRLTKEENDERDKLYKSRLEFHKNELIRIKNILQEEHNILLFKNKQHIEKILNEFKISEISKINSELDLITTSNVKIVEAYIDNFNKNKQKLKSELDNELSNIYNVSFEKINNDLKIYKNIQQTKINNELETYRLKTLDLINTENTNTRNKSITSLNQEISKLKDELYGKATEEIDSKVNEYKVTLKEAELLTEKKRIEAHNSSLRRLNEKYRKLEEDTIFQLNQKYKLKQEELVKKHKIFKDNLLEEQSLAKKQIDKTLDDYRSDIAKNIEIEKQKILKEADEYRKIELNKINNELELYKTKTIEIIDKDNSNTRTQFMNNLNQEISKLKDELYGKATEEIDSKVNEYKVTLKEAELLTEKKRIEAHNSSLRRLNEKYRKLEEDTIFQLNQKYKLKQEELVKKHSQQEILMKQELDKTLEVYKSGITKNIEIEKQKVIKEVEEYRKVEISKINKNNEQLKISLEKERIAYHNQEQANIVKNIQKQIKLKEEELTTIMKADLEKSYMDTLSKNMIELNNKKEISLRAIQSSIDELHKIRDTLHLNNIKAEESRITYFKNMEKLMIQKLQKIENRKIQELEIYLQKKMLDVDEQISKRVAKSNADEDKRIIDLYKKTNLEVDDYKKRKVKMIEKQLADDYLVEKGNQSKLLEKERMKIYQTEREAMMEKINTEYAIQRENLTKKIEREEMRLMEKLEQTMKIRDDEHIKYIEDRKKAHEQELIVILKDALKKLKEDNKSELDAIKDEYKKLEDERSKVDAYVISTRSQANLLLETAKRERDDIENETRNIKKTIETEKRKAFEKILDAQKKAAALMNIALEDS